MNYVAILCMYSYFIASLHSGAQPSSNKVLNNEISNMSHPSLVYTNSNLRCHQFFLISNQKKKEESK